MAHLFESLKNYIWKHDYENLKGHFFLRETNGGMSNDA